MEVMELLLLNEKDEKAVTEIICEELDVAPFKENTLILQGKGYELTVGIVTRHTKTDPPDFFMRQIDHLHEYYECASELTSMLVIVKYSGESEGNEVESRMQRLVERLAESELTILC